MLIFRDRVGSWLKKSIRDKPIKGHPLICLQIIRGPFRAPSTHEIAQDGEFFVADCEGFCHLNCFSEKVQSAHTSRGPLRPGRRLARRQHTLTSAATAAQPFNESGNAGARSYRQTRQRFSGQQADVTAPQALNLHAPLGTHANNQIPPPHG